MIQLIANRQDNNDTVYLDVDSEGGIQITKTVADVREFAERQGGFTFQFDLPFTPKNNNFFEHYYEVSQTIGDTPVFNPYARTDIEILADGIGVLRGYLQLNDVKTQSRVYSVTCYDAVGLLKERVGEKTLRDFSAAFNNYYQHEFNAENIWNSTDDAGAPAGAGGIVLSNNERTTDVKYPYCDYGDGHTGDSFFGTGNTDILDIQFRPWFSINLLFRTILAEAGYTNIESSFLNSDRWKRVYMLGATGRINTVLPAWRFLTSLNQFDYENTDPNIGVISNPIGFNFASGSNVPGSNNTMFNVPGGNQILNAATDRLNITSSGTYQFSFSLDFFVRIGDSGWRFGEELQLNLFNAASSQAVNLGTFTFTTSFRTSPASYTGVRNVFLSSGDWEAQIIVKKFGTQGSFSVLRYRFLDNSFLQLTNAPTIGANGIVRPELNLPNMRQVEFIRGISQQFNLFIEPDPNDDTKLFIDPYPTYMAAGESVDWTDKLDLSKEVVIEPMQKFRRSVFSLKYTDDEDYFTNWRVERVGDRASLGSKWLEDNSEFSEGEEVTELPFGAPPFYNMNYLDGSAGTPTMRFNDRDDGQISPPEELIPRLAFINSQEANFGVLSSQLRIIDTSTMNPVSFVFDYADIIDAVDRVDLTFNRRSNWGNKASIPRSFGNTTAMASDDSYSLFYDQYLREIYGKNAKMVTAYFSLSPLDVARFRFNSLIFVKDTYYRVNKIQGYTPGVRKSTKVELLKLDPFGSVNRDCDFVVDEFFADGRITFKKPLGFDNSGNVIYSQPTGIVSRKCCEAAGGVYTPDGDTGTCTWGDPLTPDLPPGFAPPGGDAELVGACCYGESECAVTTLEVCNAIEGIWQGAGSDCDDCEPETPTGACCFPGGFCTDDLEEADCNNEGGVWHEGADCADIECGS